MSSTPMRRDVFPPAGRETVSVNVELIDGRREFVVTYDDGSKAIFD
jgi:hypothetical protein